MPSVIKLSENKPVYMLNKKPGFTLTVDKGIFYPYVKCRRINTILLSFLSTYLFVVGIYILDEHKEMYLLKIMAIKTMYCMIHPFFVLQTKNPLTNL